ncbi:MAG: TIGR03013 family PEP-CTERM/XrtA system glycosyltransferase [Kordiimonadaceae bacterium]|nr:TIGR03013 family PEP-CTERM/XrtA system glycosyltransferase [Kordiimonadaceae bacterium]
MVRIFRHYVSPVKLTLAVMDFMVFLGAVFLAEWLRYSYLDLHLSSNAQSMVAKVLVPVIILPILLGVGGYQSDALRDTRVFFVRLGAAVFGAAIILSAALFMLPTLPLWRSILVLTIVLGASVVFLVHWLMLHFADYRFLGRNVIVLGAGENAQELVDYAARAPEAGLNIVKVVALPGGKNLVEGAVQLGDIPIFDKYAHESQAEMILIAEDLGIELLIEELIACKLSGIEVKDRLSFYEQVRGYVDLSSVKAEWIIFSDGFKGGSGFERLAKRLLDITVSSVLLIAALPIMIFAGIAIKTTSRGSVFYRQERVGRYGKSFKLLKFRSMKEDAEAEGQAEWAQENDPRITLVGTFLRRTRIDELPQVVNVLRGHMSFVGPRPERPFFVDQLQKDVPFYRERHCLKPGITGWAQIQYPYGASFEDSKRKLEYDLYYIKNYSIFLDLLIILQTVRVLLFPIGVR